MGLYVSTVAADVEVRELGIMLAHPIVDFAVSEQFSGVEVQRADSLTSAIHSGALLWRKVAAGPVQLAADYDPDYLLGFEGSTGGGAPFDRLALLGNFAFDPTGTYYTATSLDGAVREAKPIYHIDFDPSVTGLAALPGSFAVRTTVPVGFWQKAGVADLAWLAVGFGAGGGSGVTPPFLFTKGGNATSGSYLSVGDVPSSSCGHTVPGLNKVVKLTVSVSSLASGGQTLQLARRTGLGTFTDIVGASITMANGTYTTTVVIDVNLNEDEEVGARVSVGAFKDPVLNVFVIPR